MIALALALSLAADPDLGWLAGEWCTEKAEGAKVTCEHWRDMGGGRLSGMSKTRHERFVTIDEHMAIRPDGDGFVFHAEPKGQKPTDFRSAGGQPAMSLRFENRAHDYPQVVRYRRAGDVLTAEISLADGGKPMRWRYRLQRKD